MSIHTDYPPASILYADLREKWKHEDELINQRVTWTLASQGFLFSAFGLIAKLRLDISTDWLASPDDLSKVRFWLYSSCEMLVAISGVVVMHFMRHGIHAAISAMNVISKELKEHQLKDRVWLKIRVDVLAATTQAGTSPIRGMANTFSAAWILLFFYEVLRLASLGGQSLVGLKLLLAAILASFLIFNRLSKKRRKTE